MQKLKFQYQRPVKIDPNDGIRKRYPHMRNAYFKKFSTYPERSFYFFHLIEYKDYPLKLRVARGSGLPEEWDDLPSSVYKVAKAGSIIPKESISTLKRMLPKIYFI